jgi:hypothetical protein
MPHVRGHWRNGRYVRPHYRRSTPRAHHGSGRVWVTTYRRRNGSLVPGHWRNVSGPSGGNQGATAEARRLFILFLLIVLLIAMFAS